MADLTALRDALPFFKAGRGKTETSWWTVTPSGNYAADLETGKKYARDFLPMMTFNAGAATLGAIASDMAKAVAARRKIRRTTAALTPAHSDSF